MSTARLTHALLAASTAALLAACGGGGDDAAANGNSGSASTETLQSASANGVVAAHDGARAQAAVLGAARAVVLVGTASQTVACAGGGTAQFTATAGSAGSLTNGLLDTGEVYSMQFFDCRSQADAASVTGALTLTVNQASGENMSVTTSTQAVVVALPERTVTFNGSSTLSHTVEANGATVVTTDRWVAPSLSMVSLRNGRSTSFALTNVDFTRSVTTTNGVLVGSSNQGGLTMTYIGPIGTWTASIATQGTATFNASGVPLAGAWLITLPRDLIALQVGNGNALLTIDFGRNGSIDRSYIWPVLSLTAEAG